MRLWILLALISLVHAEATTNTTEAAVETATNSSETKEKRRTADETSVQNTDYEDYGSKQPTQLLNLFSQNSASVPTKDQLSYFLQKQPQLTYAPVAPQIPAAHVSYVPVHSLLGPHAAQGQFPKYNFAYLPGQVQKHQPGGTTFTIQYVPASSIYRSTGNSQKYELVSKTQQIPAKTPSSPAQNTLLYVTPAQGYPFLHGNPQYPAVQTQSPYLHPHFGHPAPVPSQTSGGIVYTLQPVVMTFALPGTPPGGHNPLLAALGGARGTTTPLVYYPGVHPGASTVPYALQRQQVAYVLPSSGSQQQAVTPRAAISGSSYASPATQNVAPTFRIHSQTTPHFQQVKG